MLSIPRGSRHSALLSPVSGLCYAAPSIVFYMADLALRAHISRAAVPVLARLRPSAEAPCLTTLVIARPGHSAGPVKPKYNAPGPTTCPYGSGSAARGSAHQSTESHDTADEESWSGGCIYLAVPSLGRLPYLQWHPFSICGSADSGSSLVVHVYATSRQRWTRGLAALVSRRAGPDKDAADQQLLMHVIGPVPAPPALLDCVSEARAGLPLLLVGGGSGIVPLVAILRRLTSGPMPASASVQLVIVIREACALEQLLDGRLLPVDASTGQTGFPWLRCEIYLTSKCHSEAELVDERGVPYAASTQFGPTSGDQSSSKRVVARIAPDPEERADVTCTDDEEVVRLSGPFRADFKAGALCARESPFEPLSSCTRPTGVPLQVYEAVSLIGALVGYVAIAWPLVWSSESAPWARKNAPTSTTGGGGFVVATLCAGIVAAALLWMCDVVALLRFTMARFSAFGTGGLLTVLGRTTTSTASLKAHDHASAAAAESVTPTRNGLPGTPQAGHMVADMVAGGISLVSFPHQAEPPTSCVGESSAVVAARDTEVHVPLASRTRPDFDVVVQRVPHWTRVAAGGPPGMLKALATALDNAAMAPYVCLTHSM